MRTSARFVRLGLLFRPEADQLPTRRQLVPTRRPIGVTLGPDGSVLVADDVGDVVWRVTGEQQG